MMEKQERRAATAAYKSRPQEGGIYQIRNTETGRILLGWTLDLKGTANRLQFSQMTNSCVHPALKDDWKTYGGKAFLYETLEPLKQTETQTADAFRADVQALYELWQEKLDGTPQY